MKQTIKPAQIDEHTVIGNVLHDSFDNRAFFERRQSFRLFHIQLFFENELAGQDDVAALTVQLNHPALNVLTSERIEVLDRPHVDLGTRQKCSHTDVHTETALDSFDDATRHDRSVIVGFFDVFPDTNLFRLFLGKNDMSIAVFGLFNKDVHFIADSDFEHSRFILKLADRYQPLGLVSDIHDSVILGDLQDRPFENFTFFKFAESAVLI